MRQKMILRLFMPGLLLATLFLICAIPLDPLKNPLNAGVELIIDDSLVTKGDVLQDSIGDTVVFKIYRNLVTLIDSVSVDFGGDTSIMYQSTAFPDDTLIFLHAFSEPGKKVIGYTLYLADHTSRTTDSVVTLDILYKSLAFVKHLPDTLHTLRDGDTLEVSLSVKGGNGDTVDFKIIAEDLPESTHAEIRIDTAESLFTLLYAVPINASGQIFISLEASDGEFTDTVMVKMDILDSTPPNPPMFTSAQTVNTTTPSWNWRSGGNSGAGIYRYVLDKDNITDENSGGIDSGSYTTPQSLTEGVHTLMVQERDSSGNWSKPSVWSVLIDRNAPDAPVVTGKSPTSDPRPVWTWNGSNQIDPRYRVKLDNGVFSHDTALLKVTTFTPSENLEDGMHTLFVQEKDEAGNWSVSGSYTITVDLSGPNSPTVKGVSPTSNRRPAWTWSPNGGGKGYFRCIIDSDTFDGDEFQTSALFYNPSIDLSEGEHTLYVQEQDTAGNWSAAGKAKILVDATAPEAPAISAPGASNSLQPTWNWTSGGGGNGHFRYKLDNDDLSTGATVNTSVAFTPPTNLSEGPHTFFIQESDSTGNWSEIESRVIIVDTVSPPAPKIEGPVLTNNRKPKWTFSAVTGGDGTFRCSIDSKDMGAGIVLTKEYSYNPEPDLNEGKHTLFVQARDAAGNWSKLDSFSTEIDITAPNAPLVEGYQITNSLKPLWVWKSASNGGLGRFRVKLESGAFDNSESEMSETYFEPKENLELKGAVDTFTLFVQERDLAGNWSTSGSFSTVVDTSKPGAPLVFAVSPTNNTTPSWSWRSGGGIGIYKYKLGDTLFSTIADTSTDTLFSPSVALTEGSYRLYVIEKDSAGNWSVPGSFSITVDITPPTAPEVSGISPVNMLRPVWAWVTGGNGGNGTFRYRLDNSNLSTGTVQTTTASFTPESDLSVTSHTLFVQERDAAGNWSSSDSFAIMIEQDPPEPPVVTGTTPVKTQRPVWSWTSGGGGAGTYRYKIDQTDLTSGADLTNLTTVTPPVDLAEGLHTLYLQEQDAAGNWSTSGSKVINVDMTAPAAPVVNGITPNNNSKPTWNWTSAGGGGIGTYRCKIDSDDLETGATPVTATSFIPPVAFDNLTTHTLYVQERDSAENWSSPGSFAITVDFEPPLSPVFTSQPPAVTPSRVAAWSWQSGGNGNGKFTYYLNGGAKGEKASDTSYTSKELNEGSHVFEVMEHDDAGNASIRAQSPVYVLPAPGNLVATIKAKELFFIGVQLKWTDSASTDDSIVVYRQLEEECLFEKCIRPRFLRIAVLAANATSFLDETVSECSMYNYYVTSWKNGIPVKSNTVSILAESLSIRCEIFLRERELLKE